MEKSKKSKALRIAAAILGALIALYCAYYLISGFVFGNSLPMPLGFGAAVVLTGSMEPVLSENDLIVVVKSAQYNVGDIVVYTTGGTPVVHRVIETDDGGGILVTKGDANNTADAPISLSKVLGKVAFSLPLIGIVPRFVRTVPGMLLTLVVLFVLAFLSSQSRKKAAQDAQKQSETEAEIARLRAVTGASREDTDAVDLRSEKEKEIERLRAYLAEDSHKNKEENKED